MLHEWVRMSDPAPRLPAYLAPVFGLLAGIVYTVQGTVSLAAIAVAVTALSVFAIQIVRGRADKPAHAGWAVMGVVYIIIPVLMIITLRGNEIGFDTTGFKILSFILVCVIAADVGAYFGGSTIGGPKLAPKLSPNKTWSGFISGQLLAVILGALVGHLIGLGWVRGAMLALPLAILSVLGDLFESGVKRRLGVKDAGELMPGHGGLLDRLDSLMAAVTGAAILLLIFPGLWSLS